MQSPFDAVVDVQNGESARHLRKVRVLSLRGPHRGLPDRTATGARASAVVVNGGRVAALVLCGLAAQAMAQPAAVDAALLERIDAFVEGERQASGIPGIAPELALVLAAVLLLLCWPLVRHFVLRRRP